MSSVDEKSRGNVIIVGVAASFIPRKKNLRWKLACRVFIRKCPWHWHLWGSEGRRIGQERLNTAVVATEASVAFWKAWSGADAFESFCNWGGWDRPRLNPINRLLNVGDSRMSWHWDKVALLSQGQVPEGDLAEGGQLSTHLEARVLGMGVIWAHSTAPTTV